MLLTGPCSHFTWMEACMFMQFRGSFDELYCVDFIMSSPMPHANLLALQKLGISVPYVFTFLIINWKRQELDFWSCRLNTSTQLQFKKRKIHVNYIYVSELGYKTLIKTYKKLKYLGKKKLFIINMIFFSVSTFVKIHFVHHKNGPTRWPDLPRKAVTSASPTNCNSFFSLSPTQEILLVGIF